MKRLAAFLLTLLLLGIAPLLATTYYVSQVDGNDSYDGLSPTYVSGTNGPWLTIARADNLSGDQSDNAVWFKCGGTWNEQWILLCYGTSGHQFTIGAYGTGAKPIIDAQNTRNYCIYSDAKNYYTIDGLQLQNAINAATGGGSYGGCVRAASSGTGIRIQNCDIIHPKGFGIMLGNCTNATITLNLIDTGIVADSNQYEADGIYCQNGDGGLSITHNTILERRDAGSYYIDGIQTVNEAGGEIAYNFIANPTGYSSVAGNMLIQLETGTGTWAVHHNILFNDTNKKGVFPIEGAATYHVYNNAIINIASENGDDQAISVCLTVKATYTPTEFKLKNNILYTSYALNWRWLPATDPTAANVNYNLLYRESGTNLVYLDTERTWAAWQGLGYDANGLNADPVFVSLGDGTDPANSKLQSGSPCRDTGVNLSLTEDYWGTSIPQNVTPDIGAHEYPVSTYIPKVIIIK